MFSFNNHSQLLLLKMVCLLLTLCLSSINGWSMKDPTRPSSYRYSAVESKGLNLESVLISEQRKVAVINGTAVSVGEEIGGAKVVAIEKNNVRVNQHGKTVTLTLDSVSIRQEK